MNELGQVQFYGKSGIIIHGQRSDVNRLFRTRDFKPTVCVSSILNRINQPLTSSDLLQTEVYHSILSIDFITN